MTVDDLRSLSADVLLTLFIGALFVVLFGVHRLDLRRRRRRIAAIRASGDYGPNASAVNAVLDEAGAMTSAIAIALATERRRAFDWDPRLDRPPREARSARDRAFANERDDVASAAAAAGRDAALGAVAAGTLDEANRREAAECAAETAAALVAVERIPAVEFRMLTRAWRTVVGPVGVAPRKEA